jgi:hypothetical protein
MRNSLNHFRVPPNQDNDSDQASNTQEQKERTQTLASSSSRIHGHHISPVAAVFT